MSRWVQTCNLCGALGPYGYYRRNPDGTHGRAWACPEHREAVKALPGVEVLTQTSETPAVAVPVPTARKAGGQGSLL